MPSNKTGRHHSKSPLAQVLLAGDNRWPWRGVREGGTNWVNWASKCPNSYGWSRCVNRHRKCTLMPSVAVASNSSQCFLSRSTLQVCSGHDARWLIDELQHKPAWVSISALAETQNNLRLQTKKRENYKFLFFLLCNSDPTNFVSPNNIYAAAAWLPYCHTSITLVFFFFYNA